MKEFQGWAVFNSNGNYVRKSLDGSEFHAWKNVAERYQVKIDDLKALKYTCQPVRVIPEPEGANNAE